MGATNITKDPGMGLSLENDTPVSAPGKTDFGGWTNPPLVTAPGKTNFGGWTNPPRAYPPRPPTAVPPKVPRVVIAPPVYTPKPKINWNVSGGFARTDSPSGGPKSSDPTKSQGGYNPATGSGLGTIRAQDKGLFTQDELDRRTGGGTSGGGSNSSAGGGSANPGGAGGNIAGGGNRDPQH